MKPIDNRRTRGLPPFRILVGGLTQGSDPSRGTAGNPVRSRVAFDQQIFSTNEGLNYLGHSEGDILAATSDLTVADDDFTTGLTVLHLGEYELLSGVDFGSGSGPPVAGEDITNTAPNGILTLFDTAGPNVINVPATLPIVPGTVTIHWISGAALYSQTDDGLGGFTGDGTPGASAIDYNTGAITLDTAALPPDGATTITIDYTPVAVPGNVATEVAAAISNLKGFTALAVGPVVTVTGPTGPDGGTVPFYAVYGGSVTNFTFVPADGYLTVGAPVIGPIDQLP